LLSPIFGFIFGEGEIGAAIRAAVLVKCCCCGRGIGVDVIVRRGIAKLETISGSSANLGEQESVETIWAPTEVLLVLTCVRQPFL